MTACLIRRANALVVVNSRRGPCIDIDLCHTRYFRPVHRDGAPYHVELTIDGWVPARAAECAGVALDPDEAIMLGEALIEIGRRAAALMLAPERPLGTDDRSGEGIGAGGNAR